MKFGRYILLLLLISCNNHPQRTDTITVAAPEVIPQQNSAINNPGKEICWIGTLNTKTPVFIHYAPVNSNLLAGEIIYLNTKDKLPIKLLGTIEEDKSYRLLEFEPSGNISGVITGTPTATGFTGSWVSPRTKKELVLSLQKKDTTVNSVETVATLQDVFGSYRYQYSESGYTGGLEISSLPGAKASFNINSVTSDPARNIADIPEDTINLSTTHFMYKLPDSNDCEFEVKFFKGFAFIRYTKGFCDGEFGHNATIDGIFLKTK